MSTRIVLAAMLSGVVFGLGLGVSGLTDPDRVLQFLTLDENWSPALMFTMGAGVTVAYFGFRRVQASGPLLCEDLQLPGRTVIDKPLLIGSAVFGVGWGVAGFCPGPAIAGLSSGMLEPFVFVAALIAGSQVRKMTA